MENLKSLSLICNILVVTTIISMSVGDCRVLQPNEAEFVAKICKQTPYPSACLESLKANPRSSSADAKGLALIMVDVIKAKTTDAVKKINQLLPKSSGADKTSLSACLAGYKLILEAPHPGAAELILAFYGEGIVAVVASACEDGFNAGKSPSPLSNENKGVEIAANVGMAIIKIAFNLPR